MADQPSHAKTVVEQLARLRNDYRTRLPAELAALTALAVSLGDGESDRVSLEELHHRHLDPTPYDHTQSRGTSSAKYAVHNFEDRGANQIIPHKDLFKGHFKYVARSARDERHVDAEHILGDFAERIVGFSEAQARKEGERCMSCGMCFECDNCIIFCPQTAVSRVPKKDRAVGRYVQTDYGKCVGCHICADVCPTGYIQMGLGE